MDHWQNYLCHFGSSINTIKLNTICQHPMNLFIFFLLLSSSALWGSMPYWGLSFFIRDSMFPYLIFFIGLSLHLFHSHLFSGCRSHSYLNNGNFFICCLCVTFIFYLFSISFFLRFCIHLAECFLIGDSHC